MWEVHFHGLMPKDIEFCSITPACYTDTGLFCGKFGRKKMFPNDKLGSTLKIIHHTEIKFPSSSFKCIHWNCRRYVSILPSRVNKLRADPHFMRFFARTCYCSSIGTTFFMFFPNQVFFLLPLL